MMKRGWWAAALVLLGAAGVTVWQVSSARGRAAQVWAAIPPRPPMEDAAPALLSRLEQAEDRAYDGPDRVDGLRALTRLYHANGFLAEARQGYEGLLAIEPDNPRYRHLLASILASFGDLDGAIELWLEVRERAPDFLPAQVRLGDAYLKRNLDAEADAVYAGVLERDPQNAYALVGRGRVAINRRDWEAARAFLKRATAATDDRIGGDLLATVYEELGQDEAALDLRARADRMGSFTDQPDPWLDELLPVCYDPFRLSVSGGLAAFSGDTEKGLRWLRRAAEIDPEDSNIQFQIAQVLRTAGRGEEALQAFQRITEMNPEFSDGWFWTAQMFLAKGMEGSATRALLDGLKHCPDSPSLHLDYGKRLEENGRLEAAIDEYRESIRLRPNEASAYNALAAALIKTNRDDEAEAALRDALKVEPADPFALSVLAMQTIAKGDREEATRLLERCRQHPRLRGKSVERLEEAFASVFGDGASR